MVVCKHICWTGGGGGGFCTKRELASKYTMHSLILVREFNQQYDSFLWVSRDRITTLLASYLKDSKTKKNALSI